MLRGSFTPLELTINGLTYVVDREIYVNFLKDKANVLTTITIEIDGARRDYITIENEKIPSGAMLVEFIYMFNINGRPDYFDTYIHDMKPPREDIPVYLAIYKCMENLFIKSISDIILPLLDDLDSIVTINTYDNATFATAEAAVRLIRLWYENTDTEIAFDKEVVSKAILKSCPVLAQEKIQKHIGCFLKARPELFKITGFGSECVQTIQTIYSKPFIHHHDDLIALLK